MTQTAPSDFSPFAYEPIRRDTRAPQASDAPPLPDHENAMRLLRGPTNPRDRVLSPLAQRWMEGLPPAQQPHTLCHTYPRVANRIALCWGDHTLCGLVFADLLGNRRQGRRGFPAAVSEELFALRELAGHGPKAPAPQKRRIF